VGGLRGLCGLQKDVALLQWSRMGSGLGLTQGALK